MHISNKHVGGWRANLDTFEWPDKMKQLVYRCWAQEPKERPTFSEICEELDAWSNFKRAASSSDDASGPGMRRMSVAQAGGGEGDGPAYS